MNERRNIRLFYVSVTWVALATVMHIYVDRNDTSWQDIAANIMFAGSVIFLLLMTWFVFRPQIKAISAAMGAMNRTMAQMQLLKTIATAANESESVQDGLKTAIDTICAYAGWQVGHVYLYSPAHQALVSSGVWHLADGERMRDFVIASSMAELDPRHSFLGEVYTDSTPMWIMDVADSTIYTRKESAVAAGLKAAFAFPIFVGRKAVAVMEFYSHEASIPDETLLSVMANTGRQLGQTIERAQFKERARLLETVIQSANDAIIITNTNLDNEGPQIVYVNAAFSTISGYAPSEVQGKSPRFLQNEFTKRETLDAMKEALVAGEAFKGELLNSHKDGTHYWIDISVMPVRNEEGIITHYAAIERDITAKKQEEMREKNMWLELQRANMKAEAATRELQASLKKAEEANKAKSDFLANMSHELRTPMNGVLGMAQLLADTEMDAEQRELVGTINLSGENLLMLLNDILDFSKIEAGALELEHIAYGVRDSLNATVQLLRPNAVKKNIDLLLECEEAVPLFAMGDGGRLRQVLTNLIGNAIKFTEYGYVRVDAAMETTESGDLLHVRVADTGIGIPEDKLPTIFDKFTQADASVTRKYGGTGLGLAISKQLVSLMGGTMGVESVAGKGSTFWFTIPCPATQENIISERQEKFYQRTVFSGERISIRAAKALLVEDYPINRIFAEKLLRKFGITHLDYAENGADALLQYRRNVYDVIFMDCQMPELDGYQATEKIRLIEEGTPHHTPIIAMTANAMMGDREKCLKAGMDDYVSKPLRAAHVKSVLQSLFILEEGNAGEAISAIPSMDAQIAEEAPVDLSQLRLFTDGDPEEERALAELFHDQASQMIAILAANMEGEQADAWKSAAHRFKGASGNLGAMKLHQLCTFAEQHSKDDADQKNAMLAGIRLEATRVHHFMQSECGAA